MPKGISRGNADRAAVSTITKKYCRIVMRQAAVFYNSDLPAFWQDENHESNPTDYTANRYKPPLEA